LHHTFVPAFNDGAGTNFELERYTAIDAAVKLFAVGCQFARVADVIYCWFLF